ncbi:MAG: peptidoglycan DD-metalloendopeptidase family protein [Bacteroidetes bacterium]|nr:peptidoglycan DD-metalloendopeptidase family protein [Bacteroidota bacterium]MBS1540624.1 peptidoglycan DD-metalloendopeptidase family protein [Bacteroidota bacterium]
MTTKKKIFLFTSAGSLLLALTLFLLANYTQFFEHPADYEVAIDSSKFIPVEQPVFRYGIKVNQMDIREGRVKRNELFANLLTGAFVPAKINRQISLLPKSVFDFRKISESKKYTVITQNDSAKTAVALIYETSPTEYSIFHFTDTLTVETHQREIKTEEKSVSGEILSSLYETIDQLKISPELTNKFVDVFGWQVDFQHLQKGDRFKLIYQENSVDGNPYNIGKILGIYFRHADHDYYAFPFDQGDGIDYFDEQGNSLRKALLKYPIEFTRISSRYSLSRFHPVVKVFRPHLGTDFAAATGTPIRSVGDGVVAEAQYDINNGNFVKIRHNGTYTTGYLHMSKIAAGIVAGTHVRQGQTIGYVGSTGLATGPHLCYRFWKNGIQVDALRVDLPPAKPIEKNNWKQYDDVMVLTMLRLQSISFDEKLFNVATTP